MKLHQIFHDFLAGGWVISTLGGIGIVIRVLTGNIKYTSFIDLGAKICSSILFTTFIWALISNNHEMADWVKAIIYGISGLIGPEIIKGLVFLGNAFSTDPIKTINDIKETKD